MRTERDEKEIVKRALALLHEPKEESLLGQEIEDGLTTIRAWVVEEIRAENGELRAVFICSAVMENHQWVIWDHRFEPRDSFAIYFGEEIPLLRGKSLEDLKLIHETKLIFPGARVVQERAERNGS